MWLQDHGDTNTRIVSNGIPEAVRDALRPRMKLRLEMPNCDKKKKPIFRWWTKGHMRTSWRSEYYSLSAVRHTAIK